MTPGSRSGEDMLGRDLSGAILSGMRCFCAEDSVPWFVQTSSVGCREALQSGIYMVLARKAVVC